MFPYIENFRKSQLTNIGGFKHFFIFHNIWDNPSHWRTHIFQDGWHHQPGLERFFCVNTAFGLGPLKDLPWDVDEFIVLLSSIDESTETKIALVFRTNVSKIRQMEFGKKCWPKLAMLTWPSLFGMEQQFQIPSLINLIRNNNYCNN